MIRYQLQEGQLKIAPEHYSLKNVRVVLIPTIFSTAIVVVLHLKNIGLDETWKTINT